MNKVILAKVDKIEMRYYSFGHGKKIFVILPGLSFKHVTDNGPAIGEAYKQFAKEYTVYLFDRRENMPDSYDTRAIAKDTVTVMKYLGIDKADIFGTSQGGMIGQYIAIDYPQMVNKLILGSTVCRLNDYAKSLFNKWLEFATNKQIEQLIANSIDLLYSEETLKHYRDSLIKSNLDLSQEDLKRYIIMLKSALDFDSSKQVNQINCDVLAIDCKGDRIFTYEGCADLLNFIPASHHTYGVEYSHCVYDEANDYKDIMLDFLRK